MKFGRRFVFPPDRWEERERARKLAWISIFALGSTAAVIFFAMGQSEAMKTAWIEDLLGIIPPIVLLFAMRLELRKPTKRFPYGYFRAVAIAFLITAAVLALIGFWLLFDAITKLIGRNRPPIGTMVVFGHQIWAGWAMVAALIYCVVIGVFLGVRKRPVAEKLQAKALDADADMNRAGWMSEGAAIVGVILVGSGLWWGDAVAAGFISLNILRDGGRNLREVLADLMDETPTKLGGVELEDLPERIKKAAEGMVWVREAAVRLREQGHVINGEVFVVPREAEVKVAQIEDASRSLTKIDWRIYNLVVMPVSALVDDVVPTVASGS